MKRGRVWLLGLVLALLLAGRALAAQDGPHLLRQVFSGGGSVTQAGEISINASFGQPLTGSSSAGDLTLHSGYWQKQYYALYLPVISR